MTSGDQLFRPVNISNAPDGTVYIADMYHGIIQELQWSGPGSYLRAKIEQYQLDKVAAHGRIWRLRYDGRPAVPATDTNIGQPAIPAIAPDFAPPRMYSETPAQLVAHLTHAERLVARHGAAAADPQAGQVGRAGARADGAVVGQPAWRASTRCGRSKASARSMRALVREEMKDARTRACASRRSAPAKRSTRPATSRSPTTTARSTQGRRSERRHPGDADAEPVQAAGRGRRRSRPRRRRTRPRAWRSSASACCAAGGDQLSAAAAPRRRADAREAEAAAAGQRRVRRACASRVTAPTASGSRWRARRPAR